MSLLRNLLTASKLVQSQQHLHHKQNYIACKTFNLTWDMEELEQVYRMSLAGECISKIARVLQRREEEVQILIIDLAKRSSQIVN